MGFDTYKYKIESDSDMAQNLNHIAAIIRDNKKEIKSIRYSSHCSNCFERDIDYTVEFKNKLTTIKGYSKSCSFSEYSRVYNFTTKRLIEDFSDIKLDEDEYHFFLTLKTYDLFNTTLPLSPYYPHETGMDKEWNLYKINKIKVKIREYDDKLIIAMPDFIDFKGLKPMYAAILIIEFK